MRKPTLLTGALFFIAALPFGTAMAQDDNGNPLSDYSQPELPDPVPFKGVPYAPGTATATVAATSQAHVAADNCTALNPCAMPTPANASSSAAVKPAR